jgi:hypothetical protein
MALTERYPLAQPPPAPETALCRQIRLRWTRCLPRLERIRHWRPSQRYNIKADGTYNRTLDDDFGGGGFGTNTLPIVLRGYKTTPDGYLGHC